MMKNRGKSKDLSSTRHASFQSSDLEKELTKALEKSSAALAERFDDIAKRYKNKHQTEQAA